VQHGAAVTTQIVDGGQTGKNGGRVDRRHVSGRAAADNLSPRPQIERQPRRDDPAILQVERGRADIQLRAARRAEIPRLRDTGREDRNGTPRRSNDRTAGSHCVIGGKHPAG
jgi:hypothetical protein